MIVLGVGVTLVVSKLLSKTFLKGMPTSFSLELPPYRKPKIRKILWRSLIDRTLKVLWRAVKVALPAGLVIWLLANIYAGDFPLFYYIAKSLHPFARLMGLDGTMLTAFVLGFPANEIVLPIAVMGYAGSNTLTDFTSISQLGSILKSAGWTIPMGVSLLLFTLFHFPCATTMLTIKKETSRLRWTLLSFILPTVIGIALCMAFTGIVHLFLLI